MIKNIFKGLVIILAVSLFVWQAEGALSQNFSDALRGDRVYDFMVEDGTDSQKAVAGITNLEQMLKGPRIADPAQLLFNMAKLKIFAGYDYKNNDYVKTHPEEYTYHELGDFYIYKGNDLERVMKEYNTGKIADDAAYMYATLPKQGECEGDVSCALGSDLASFTTFFEQYSGSPYIRPAILDVNETFKPLIDDPKFDLTDKEYKKLIIEQLDKYYSMLEKLDNKNKVYGLHPLARAYTKVGNQPKASEIYRKIIKEYPDYPDMNKVKTENAKLKEKK